MLQKFGHLEQQGKGVESMGFNILEHYERRRRGETGKTKITRKSHYQDIVVTKHNKYSTMTWQQVFPWMDCGGLYWDG